MCIRNVNVTPASSVIQRVPHQVRKIMDASLSHILIHVEMSSLVNSVIMKIVGEEI
jgi:hypothetical protein